MQRIVVLISGRGSNLEAIVQRAAAEGWAAQVVGVVSNRADSAGLAWAVRQGIATCVVDHRAHADRASFDTALADSIDAHAPDWVVMAGFMRILGDGFVQRYANRMLNIHPSLLPAFTGLHTHRRALEAGCRVAGATVHFVTPTLDHGPIVAQAVVPVKAGDDQATLADRVLAAEHLLYPMALRWAVEGRLRIEGQRVVQLDGAPQHLFVD
jgi:phosphoribosylglycinamide formyltransferase 1